MGYLTTITIYNDGAHALKKHPEDLAEQLDWATKGVQRQRGRNYAPLGNNANLLTLQKPRHADDHTLYMHAGNTVVDIFDVYDDPVKHKFFVDTFINQMEYHLKKMKKLKKEINE